jgi:hypothetical protein
LVITFFSFDELNLAIADLLEKLNVPLRQGPASWPSASIRFGWAQYDYPEHTGEYDRAHGVEPTSA